MHNLNCTYLAYTSFTSGVTNRGLAAFLNNHFSTILCLDQKEGDPEHITMIVNGKYVQKIVTEGS